MIILILSILISFTVEASELSEDFDMYKQQGIEDPFTGNKVPLTESTKNSINLFLSENGPKYPKLEETKGLLAKCACPPPEKTDCYLEYYLSGKVFFEIKCFGSTSCNLKKLRYPNSKHPYISVVNKICPHGNKAFLILQNDPIFNTRWAKKYFGKDGNLIEENNVIYWKSN